MGQAKRRGTFEERREQALAVRTTQKPVSVQLTNGDVIETKPRPRMRSPMLGMSMVAALAAMSIPTGRIR